MTITIADVLKTLNVHTQDDLSGADVYVLLSRRGINRKSIALLSEWMKSAGLRIRGADAYEAGCVMEDQAYVLLG